MEIKYQKTKTIECKENDGESTIELMEWNENQTHLEPIWDNSYDSQIKRKKIINEKSN